MKNLTKEHYTVLGIVGASLLALYEIGTFNFFGIPPTLFKWNIMDQLSSVLLKILIIALIFIMLYSSSVFLFSIFSSLRVNKKWQRYFVGGSYLLMRFVFPYFFAIDLYGKYMGETKATYLWGTILSVIYSILIIVEWKKFWILRSSFYTSKPKNVLEIYNRLPQTYHLSTIIIWYCALALVSYSLGYSNASKRLNFLSYDNGKSLIVSMDESSIITIKNYKPGEFKIIPIKSIYNSTIKPITVKK